MKSKPLILALDIPSSEEMEELVEKFSPFIDIFKIGPFLFYRYGWEAVERVKKRDKKVFLDLKIHDIPRIMGEGVKIISSRGVDFFTLHLSAGGRAIREAVKNKGDTILLGVTLLTSLGERDLQNMGIAKRIEEYVKNMVNLGMEWGVDGFISSPQEVERVREITGDRSILVTPGVGWEVAPGDHQRKADVYTALSKGADYVVMGRSIIQDDKSEEKLVKLYKTLGKI